MKNTLTEMKNNLQRINSRVDETENQISNLEYMEENKKCNQNSKKKKESKKMWIVQRTSGTTSRLPTFALGVLDRREQEIENLFEKMTENFRNW